jgi:pyruvyltransferase
MKKFYYYNGDGGNFGDLLVPMLLKKICKKPYQLFPSINSEKGDVILSIGSVLGVAKPGNTIWGSGLHHLSSVMKIKDIKSLKFNAVRGPYSRRKLIDVGFDCPEIYGDPALLLGHLFSDLKPKPIKNKITLIPHFRDHEHPEVIENKLNLNIIKCAPINDPMPIINEILTSELVIASALHGIIVSESFGVPVVRWKSLGHKRIKIEGEFKYRDYYSSTDRSIYEFGTSLDECLRLNPLPINHQHLINPLLKSFPEY